jgi:UDP-glucose 4-epimerase
LVTGGAGFIGSHVCDAYVSRGWQVTALDDLSNGSLDNVPPGAEFVEMDIRSPELTELFRAGAFDLVNHHAAQVDVRVSVARPRDDASINIDGLLNVLEASRRSGVERVVYVSSGGVVYGEQDDVPIEETREKGPVSPYGVTKLIGEYYLHYYRAVHGMTSVSLRYSNVYGPRQDPQGEAGVVAIFARRALHGHPLFVYGDGEQRYGKGDERERPRWAFARGVGRGSGRAQGAKSGRAPQKCARRGQARADRLAAEV